MYIFPKATTKMEKHPHKNIQLSEKIEYLMSVGILTLNSNVNGVPVYRYQELSMKIDSNKSGGRLIDFINETIDVYGLYPYLQKFVIKKKLIEQYPLTEKEIFKA